MRHRVVPRRLDVAVIALQSGHDRRRLVTVPVALPPLQARQEAARVSSLGRRPDVARARRALAHERGEERVLPEPTVGIEREERGIAERQQLWQAGASHLPSSGVVEAVAAHGELDEQPPGGVRERGPRGLEHCPHASVAMVATGVLCLQQVDADRELFGDAP